MRKILLLLFSFLLIFIFLYKPSFGIASNFDNSYLRLANQSANSALSGTVCAQPSSSGAGTEGKILVTFPSDFTISSNASNWTTNTTNLPSGGTSWPGIGATATSVSGKTVTFASSDLTANVLYCFNFSAASSTTGSTGNDKTGSLTTENSSNTVIDSVDYALSVVSSNQISVTAKVDPQVSDLPITIEALTSGSNFSQDTTLDYKITYGNNASTSIPLTIQAEWSQGTIQGNPSPSVDILNYVVGSATNAYASTPAVIDTVNRTITWTISSIPGSTTGQTVNFQLKTNSNYTGTSIVNFSVFARATSGSTTTPDASVTQTYLYNSPAVTATPTSGPSATTTPTPTPTPSSEKLSFTNIYISSVSQNNAEIAISTSKETTLSFKYGTSISSLTNVIKTVSLQKSNVISLSGLLPNTDYYFKVTAADSDGNSITSDIFTFQTAVISPIPSIDLKSILVTSRDVVLLSPRAISETGAVLKNIIVIPRQTEFSIQFSIDKNISLKSVQAIVRNKNVLGLTTNPSVPEASSNYVNLVEVSPGVYVGKLSSPEQEGQYETYIRLIDFNGNILEQKIADLNVTLKFRVLKKGTSDQGVENARVLLYLYNPTTKIYQVISSSSIAVKNPVYSSPNGKLDLVLPIGQYKADISAIGYKPQTVNFSIDPYSGGYPIVYLQAEPFNLFYFSQYYLETLNDAFSSSQNYVREHAASSRLFDLSTFLAVLIFVIISILSVSARTHVGVFYLPYFLIFRLTLIFNKERGRIIVGKIVEKGTRLPISKVNVYIYNLDQTLASTLRTNKLGEFYFRNKLALDYDIKISKNGFVSPPSYHLSNARIERMPVVFEIKKEKETKHSRLEIFLVYTEDILGLCMEAIVLAGLLMQVYFTFTFGFLRVLPFLILTVLNIVLIFTFLYKPKALGD